MQDDRLQRLRREHRFEDWKDRGTVMIAGDVQLTPNDLPGWVVRRESRNDKVRPPVTKSVWSRGDSNEELLGIEMYRCASLQAAHEFLLWFIGEFQSAAIKERTNTGIGDVAFGLSEPTMMLFGRANYVVHVYNAGPRTTNVLDVAKAVDEKITRAGRVSNAG